MPEIELQDNRLKLVIESEDNGNSLRLINDKDVSRFFQALQKHLNEVPFGALTCERRLSNPLIYEYSWSLADNSFTWIKVLTFSSLGDSDPKVSFSAPEPGLRFSQYLGTLEIRRLLVELISTRNVIKVEVTVF